PSCSTAISISTARSCGSTSSPGCGASGDLTPSTRSWRRCTATFSGSGSSGSRSPAASLIRRYDPHARAKAGARPAVRRLGCRHRQDRGPGRAHDRAHQPADRASARPSQGPSLASRPADARGPAAQAAQIPAARRPRALPLARARTWPAALSPEDGAPISPGTPAPEFMLRREDGSEFTREDLLGSTTVLVFYPFAFSRVCTDQLNLYEEVLGDLK